MIAVLVRKAGAPLVAFGLFMVFFLFVAPRLAISAPAGQAPLQDHHVFLPALTRAAAQPPPAGLVNGDFEAGPVAWVEFSQQGWPLILSGDELSVPAHGGVWGVWLGGDNDEVTTLEQTFHVPGGATTLSYYVWVDSGDLCGYDEWRLTINGTQLDGFSLCEDTHTEDWVRREVSISSYAGQQVSLVFFVSTDGSFISSLFLDDVTVNTNTLQPEEAAPAAAASPAPARLPAVRTAR